MEVALVSRERKDQKLSNELVSPWKTKRELSPLGASRVGRNNHDLLGIANVVVDVAHHEGLGVHVVHRDVKETLELGIVEVQGDDVVHPGTAQLSTPPSTKTESELGGRKKEKRGGCLTILATRVPGLARHMW